MQTIEVETSEVETTEHNTDGRETNNKGQPGGEDKTSEHDDEADEEYKILRQKLVREMLNQHERKSALPSVILAVLIITKRGHRKYEIQSIFRMR